MYIGAQSIFQNCLNDCSSKSNRIITVMLAVTFIIVRIEVILPIVMKPNPSVAVVHCRTCFVLAPSATAIYIQG